MCDRVQCNVSNVINSMTVNWKCVIPVVCVKTGKGM